MTRRQIAQRRVGLEAPLALRSAERTIRNQFNPMPEAVTDDAAQDVSVLPEAQLDLHGVDANDLLRLLDLADGDVAQADPFDETVALETSGTRGSGACS